MSIKAIIGFALQIVGDGSTTVFTAILATTPISYFPYGSSAASVGLLSDVTDAVPSAVVSVSCAPSLGGVSASLELVGTELQLTFTDAPANGSFYVVSGILEF